MAAIPLLPLVAGLSGLTSFAGFLQQRAQGEATAQAADYNAKSLEQQAAATSLQAGAAEEAKRRETRAAFGKTRAAGAEFGLLESGSFADVYRQSAAAAEIDALNIRYEGEARRVGLLNQSAAEKYQAKAARKMRPSWLMGAIGAGTSALTTYGSLGGKLSGYGKAGTG